MAKFELKKRAELLRKSGQSLNEICAELGISKSTASLWCRNIELLKNVTDEIKRKHIIKTNKGRLIGAQKNKQKRIDSIQEGLNFGTKLVNKISERELVLIVTALYWSEGSKSDHSAGFQFTNSDPDMILLVKKFLNEVMHISDADLVCSIQINEIHKPRIAPVLIFWKNLLVLQNEQFRKPYFVKTKVSKVYENYDTYYGICRLMVRRSSALKYKMLGLIAALKT